MRSANNTPHPDGLQGTPGPVILDTLTPMGLMQSQLGVVIFDTDLRVVCANAAAQRLGAGIPATGWAGRQLGEVLPHIDAGPVEHSLRRVLATGEPVTDLAVSSRADGDPSGERLWSCVQFQIGGPDGKPAGVAHMMREVTERARSQHRLALASEASARIGTTLDTTRTAEELLEVTIPRLADAGAVDQLATVIKGDRLAQHEHDQKMRLRQVAVKWPADRPPPAYLRHAWIETDPKSLYHQRLVAGWPVYLPAFRAMTTGEIRELDSGTGFNRMMAARRAGAHSLITVPLTARGINMGVVVLYRLGGSEPFTPADLSLARDLISRAAVSLDNARLYTRERGTALALQRSLLPRRIPEVPGLQLACRYVPAEATAEVGGDWFDVIPLPEGRCALTVGDVTGHDMSAASLMGQLRTATRTLATFDHLTPTEILTRLNQIATDLTSDEASATCIYAVHDPRTGDWDIARAGHPLPAIARPGHKTAFPDLPPGLPLGTGIGDGKYQTTHLHLPPGSTLVLYTDGLIEDPATGMSAGLTHLARTLTTLATRPVTQACDTLLATLAPNRADDIAILMART